MCFLVQTITLVCQAAVGSSDGTNYFDYPFPDQPEFAMSVYGGFFNIMEFVVSFGKVNAAREDMGMYRPPRFQSIEFVMGLLMPFVPLRQILSATYPENPRTRNGGHLLRCVVLLRGDNFVGLAQLPWC
jgi:hypothetical protein